MDMHVPCVRLEDPVSDPVKFKITIQIAVCPCQVIKFAAEAGVNPRATTNNIIMVTLWVLFVKCRAPAITKEAILCKYSRQ